MQRTLYGEQWRTGRDPRSSGLSYACIDNRACAAVQEGPLYKHPPQRNKHHDALAMWCMYENETAQRATIPDRPNCVVSLLSPAQQGTPAAGTASRFLFSFAVRCHPSDREAAKSVMPVVGAAVSLPPCLTTLIASLCTSQLALNVANLQVCLHMLQHVQLCEETN